MTSERHRHPIRTGLTCTTAIISLLVGGCAGTLETRPYRERTDRVGAALRGVTYSLPKLQYEVKLTRWLSECPGEVSPEGKPSALRFTVDVEAKPRYVPGEAYTVDYERLAGLFRTSNFEMKWYPSGNLKSMGAGAEDKTGEVIGNVVKTGLAVASAAMGVPPVTALAGQSLSGSEVGGREGVVCSAAAHQLVREARDHKQKLKDQADLLKKIKTDIERIQSRAAVKLIDATDRQKLLDAFAAIDAAEATIEDSRGKLAKAVAKLGVSQEFLWDSRMDQSAAAQIQAYGFTDPQRDKLASLLALGALAPAAPSEQAEDEKRRAAAPACFGEEADPRDCVAQQLDLKSVVQVDTPMKPCPIGSPDCVATVSADDPRYRDARDSTPDEGIFVREPLQARLLFCRASLMKGSECTPEKDEGKLTTAFFPQLGQLRYLPLRVGTFQAREMTLALTEEGRIESFSYKSTKAVGQAVAATLADVATQVDAALEKRETERRSDLDYARAQVTGATQTEINRITKELELKKLRAPATVNPLQPILDETATLQAEIALLRAKLSKAHAEAALSALP
jgi:hypothetical protein